MSRNAQKIKAALRLEEKGRYREATDVLTEAARAGSAEAQLLLGQRMMPAVNGQAVQAQGLKLVESAVRQGLPEALHFYAVLAGSGFMRAPDWNAAMSAMREAANKGHKRAADQLAVLGADFSLTNWLTPPPVRMQSESPRVGVIEEFLPKAACDWLIATAAPRLKRATVRSGATGKSIESADRTNSSVAFDLTETDLIIRLVQERLARALGVSSAYHEYPSILHYEIGQTFATHNDFFEPTGGGYAEIQTQAGQRVATFLIYLNEDFDGGETDFPLLKWRFKGRTGDALFFWNVDQSGAVERGLAHTGLPPTRGEKWLFSQWVRERQVPLI